MADTLLHKYSLTAGKIPDPAAIATREIAINPTDGRLYIKKADGTIVLVNPPMQTASVDAGDYPISSWSFTGTIPAAVGQKVICSIGGEMSDGAFMDELEFEPLAVFGKVIAANTVQFTMTTVNAGGYFSGIRYINYYLG